MSVSFNSETGELKQVPLTYDSYCLIKDAALAIRERTPTLPGAALNALSFRAIDVSTSLADPAYAPVCQDLQVTHSRYGAREKLVIDMHERSLNPSGKRPYFYRQIGMRVKGTDVYRTWRTIHFPRLLDRLHHEQVVTPEQQVQSLLGALLLHETLASHPLNEGDELHIIRELEAFARPS